MTETLASLEDRRQQLFKQLTQLGDFRPGTISTSYRRCGKGNCACAKAGHPGHGPRYQWSTTQQGKSRAQNLRLGPELVKVETELSNYRRFGELCGEIVTISEQICRLRPTPEIKNETELDRLKKTLQQKYSRKRRKRSSG